MKAINKYLPFVMLAVALALAARPDVLHRGEAASIASQTRPCSAGANLQGIAQINSIEIARGVATGDFNGDREIDLAIGEIVQNLPITRITLWLGDGEGRFESVISFILNGAIIDLDAGNLNGDGHLDLVASSNAIGAGGGIIPLLGNGDGTFRTTDPITTAPIVLSSLIADLNDDGRDDVAIAHQFGRLSVVLSGADGKLGSPVNYEVSTTAFTIGAADFTGDGKIDLVAASQSSTMLTLLANNGSGGLSVASNPDAGGTNSSITTGDFNGDGKADVAVAQTGSVATLLGDGSGGFSPAKKIGNKGGGAIIAEDFTGDGKDDLALGRPTVIALFNDGGGNFDATATYGTGTITTGFVANDFNGDGKIDLAALGQNSRSVSILLNANGSGFQAPNVSEPSLFPAAMSVGDLTVIALFNDGGGNFDATATYGTGTITTGFVANDFNGDGKIDLAALGQNSRSVSILLNANGSGFQAPNVSEPSLFPAAMSVGD